MVRVKLGQFIDIHPLCPMLLTQLFAVILNIDKGIIGYRYHTFAWVSVDAAKSTDLTHIDIFHACQLMQSTFSGIVDAFFCTDEAAIETPFTPSGIHLTPTDEHLQLTLIKAEDDTVDRHPDLRMFVIVRHFLILEEVPVEAATEGEDTEGTQNVPYVPALGNLLAIFCCEGNGILLLGCGSSCEERHTHHQ